MEIVNKNPELLLDKGWIKNFFNNNSQKIFGKKEEITVFGIERSHTFNTESYNVLYSVEVSGRRLDIRASSSTQASRETTYKILEYLFKNGFNQGDVLVPKPIGFFSEHNLMLYQNIPGKTLMYELGRNVEELCRKIATTASGLKKFHLINVPDFQLWDIDWGLNVNAISKFYPDLASQISNIKKEILKKLEKSKNTIFCHGDYQPNNLIFNQDKLYIIDFGSVCKSDKEFDIALFIVQLRIMLNKYGRFSDINKLREIFLVTCGQYDQQKFNLYSCLWSFRILDFFIAFPDKEDNKKRIPFGYKLVKENLGNIGIKINDA